MTFLLEENYLLHLRVGLIAINRRTHGSEIFTFSDVLYPIQISIFSITIKSHVLRDCVVILSVFFSLALARKLRLKYKIIFS